VAGNAPAPEPSETTRQALETGLAFEGTVKEGLRVVFRGAEAQGAPPPNTAFPKLIPGVDASAVLDKPDLWTTRTLDYKGCLLKPVSPQQSLYLQRAEEGGKTELRWLVQDCLIEKGGQNVYRPAALPFEPQKVPLAVSRDGHVDVAP
jgi:hypothetical protein